ncbi:MAG: hypothetical protein SOZ80_03390 [Prevotella sp.]|uniref:hypothetical protein n=1 Tax=Prevotella sp. TaxID=59823 RepID=UPI002A295248|nr:hypothetical protein [Prevotella sp.]MDD7317202.1 hypothetical protein [Prevotellaceae bacterium]MDY4019806.1 hypothetical protein [Prevotella sp.]
MSKLLVFLSLFFALTSCSEIKEKVRRNLNGHASEEAKIDSESEAADAGAGGDAGDEEYSFGNIALIEFNGAGIYGLVGKANISEGVNVKYDFDNDGYDDTFIVGRDSPNGMRILWMGIRSDVGQNLINELPDDNNMIDCFDDFGELREGVSMQLSFSSHNNKKEKAALISIGRIGKSSHTYVFVYDGDNPSKVRLVDEFDSGEACYLNPRDNTFYVSSNGRVSKHEFKI